MDEPSLDVGDPRELMLRHLDRQTAPEEDGQLRDLLQNDPAMRRIFVELCHQSGLLRELRRPLAGAIPLTKPTSRRYWLSLAGAAFAASVVATIITWLASSSAPESTVATITGVENCRWTDPAPDPGVGLAANTHLNLIAGLAEITCGKGARLVVRGPANLVINASDQVTLNHGAITAFVDHPGSEGFVLQVPGGRVIDHGTAFGVDVGTNGVSRVATFQGLVEVRSVTTATRVEPGRELLLSASGELSSNVPTSDGFTHALSSSAIGLVAHWPLRDGQCDDVVAPIGTTVLNGGPVKMDGATLNLNGRQHLLVTHTRKLDLTGDLTVAAWMRTNAPVGDIVSKYDWPGRQRSFVLGLGAERDPDHYRPGHLYAWISSRANNFSGATICSSRPLNDGQWHHVAVAFTAGRSLALFIDGQRDEAAKLTGIIPPSIAVSPRHLSIGAGYRDADQPNDYYFDGNLADVRIYSISTADIAALAMTGPTSSSSIIDLPKK